jgi:hypothetical protein
VSGAARVVASFACGRYDRNEPIQSGEVTPDGMDLVPMILHPADTFLRLAHDAEFDIGATISLVLRAYFYLALARIWPGLGRRAAHLRARALGRRDRREPAGPPRRPPSVATPGPPAAGHRSVIRLSTAARAL